MFSMEVPMVSFTISLVFGIIVSLLRTIVWARRRTTIWLIVSIAVFVVLVIFPIGIVVFSGFLIAIVGVVEVSSTDIVIGQF